MRKSVLFAIIAIIVISVGILVLSSCDSGNEPQIPNDTTNSTPSDTTNNTKESETDAHAHAFGEWTTTTEPTCTEAGEESRSCSCGEAEKRIIEAKRHSYTSVVTDPTCTEKGYTTYTCACGESYVDTYVSATGHTFGGWKTTQNATCTQSGQQKRECNCGEFETKTLSSTGHSYKSVVTYPTCTERGYTTHVCQCGDSYKDTYVDAEGHKYGAGSIVTPATCIKAGTKKYSCTASNCTHTYTESYSLQTYTATEIYNQSVKYVGEITTYDKSGNEYSLGTVFVSSSDGKLITNYHVIEGAYSAKVNINGKTYTVSSVLAYDVDIDLAVLKINATGLNVAPICKNPVQAGETVYAIGSSRGMTNTYSQGIITYADRVINGISYVQHDASITHGNSGGPLINAYGEVIGINTWGISDSQNLNFAVFADELDNLVYRTPMSLAEFYELTNNAFDKLVDFILANGKYDSGNGKTELILEDGYNSSRTEYTIVQFDYNPKYNSVDLTYFVGFEDSGVSFFTGISLEEDVNSYYYAMYVRVDGATTNTISGYIDYTTFTDNTLLGYNSYEGKTSQKELTRENASLSAIYLIEYLEWLATNYLGVTISDFGFASF